MEHKIKALIFDIGGVLQLTEYVYPNRKKMASGVHDIIVKKLKISLDEYLDAIDTAYVKSITGEISEKEADSILAKNLKITPKKLEKLYMEAFKKIFSFNKELFKYAVEKKKQGYKIAILSDQWWLSKKALITKEFYKHFNPVIVSTDVKLRKPNPEIYKLTLKKLKLKPSETIFIDNQKWNTKPAEKLGMKTVLFKNNKQTIRDIERLLG